MKDGELKPKQINWMRLVILFLLYYNMGTIVFGAVLKVQTKKKTRDSNGPLLIGVGSDINTFSTTVCASSRWSVWVGSTGPWSNVSVWILTRIVPGRPFGRTRTGHNRLRIGWKVEYSVCLWGVTYRVSNTPTHESCHDTTSIIDCAN